MATPAAPKTKAPVNPLSAAKHDADKLAFVLEQVVELMPQPYGCMSCTESTKCVMHRRREAALAALAEHRKR
jgi:hypothetical protein